MGIFTEGLRIPRQDQVSNGSTLGLGCYFADCSTKRLQYCGTDSNGFGYMLVCEVALGNKHQVQNCCMDVVQAPYTSRMARGMKTIDFVECDGIYYPKGPIHDKADNSYSTFKHNEYVIFRKEQYRFRYLIRVQKY